MANQFTANMHRLIEAVLTTPGEVDFSLRRTVEARAATLSGRLSSETTGEVPPELTRYIDKVALHAYKVTDADVETLRTAGYTEDAILEITMSAVLGAGVARLERGLNALQNLP